MSQNSYLQRIKTSLLDEPGSFFGCDAKVLGGHLDAPAIPHVKRVEIVIIKSRGSLLLTSW